MTGANNRPLQAVERSGDNEFGIADGAVMSAATSPGRVVVVGGGIIGCATGRIYLTRDGFGDVAVVERDGVASGASGYSAGILTPYSGSNDAGLLALSAASLRLHAELAVSCLRLRGSIMGMI